MMTHEFRTTPSKLDSALPKLHPKHSNAQGASISVIVGVRVRVRVGQGQGQWGGYVPTTVTRLVRCDTRV